MIDINKDIEIIRTSRRKTASINIINGQVKITIPQSLSPEKLSDLISSKKDWIAKKINEHSKVKPQKQKEFVSGEAISYLGRNYRLKKIIGAETPVEFKNGYFFVGVNSDWSEGESEVHIRLELAKWLRQQALVKIKSKVKKYSEIVGVKPKSIKVHMLETKWGSCSPNGDLVFNWRIISAPHTIIDYVVVHELCHLIEHNHSEKFWSLVSRVIPDYKHHKEWLKFNGDSLGI